MNNQPMQLSFPVLAALICQGVRLTTAEDDAAFRAAQKRLRSAMLLREVAKLKRGLRK